MYEGCHGSGTCAWTWEVVNVVDLEWRYGVMITRSQGIVGTKLEIEMSFWTLYSLRLGRGAGETHRYGPVWLVPFPVSSPLVSVVGQLTDKGRIQTRMMMCRCENLGKDEYSSFFVQR